MSVKKPGEEGGQGAMQEAMRAATDSNANTRSTASTSAGGQRVRPTIMDVNARFRRPISRNSSGEAVQAFVRGLNKQIEDTMGSSYKDSFSVHVLDNNTNMIALSTILVCFNLQHAGQNHVAVFSLIVEGSAGKLQNRFINISGQNVEIDTVAGDVCDRTMWEKISAFLTDAYGVKINLHNAGAMVLPTELSAEDGEHMHRIAFNVTQALYTVVENDITGQEPPLSVSMVDNGATLTATLDYSPTGLTNAAGLPIRSDVSIVLRGQMANAGNSPHEQVREITRADGYIDLVYSEPPAPQWNQAPVTQRYYPRFVITRLDSEVDAITPELQLLALSTSTLLSRNVAWGGCFLPRYGNAGPDLRDIGAVGYEINLLPDPNAKPDRINTKSDTFGKPQMFQMLQTTIHDALIYSMDIEEVGELSWLHQVFTAAATGDADAYKSICQAADRLTDGHFSRIFTNEAIVVDDANRVHLGYYVDHSGQRRDIRDIDYLALLNLLGEKDMATVVNWSRTFDDVQMPLEVRLEQRAKILKGLVSDCRIKGYARRVTFTPAFVMALNQAAVNAGLVIRPSNLIMDFSGQVGRGTYNASGLAVGGTAASGLFNYSQPFQGGYRGVSSPYGRYGQR